MKDVVVVGGTEFSIGFQIAGISKAFSLSDEDPESTLRELISNPDIGLIIMQEDSMKDISEEFREQITQSVQPVFLVISEDQSNDEMKKLIKKSIGVDVWDK